MDNKYNLDFYETMNMVNAHLDYLTDYLTDLRRYYENKESMIEAVMSIRDELVMEFEDKLNKYMEEESYQEVCYQLVTNEMFYMFINDVVPEDDITYLEDYVDSLSEEMLIEDVTEFIDRCKQQ